MKNKIKEFSRFLMTGTSYMIPFVVGGGVLMGVATLFGGTGVGGGTGFWTNIHSSGNLLMSMMVPVLGGFIAFGIADKPGIAVGFLAGMIANAQGAGFFGGLIGGIAAGYIVVALKKYIKLPRNLAAILPILIIPVFGGFLIALVMHYIVGGPVAWLNAVFTEFLGSMDGKDGAILGLIQGAMACFDLGGPVNKAQGAIISPAVAVGNWKPMCATFVASMLPPIAQALAMIISPKDYTDEEKANIPACLAGGLSMISELAIPFAAADPLRTIPAYMLGGSLGAAASYLFELSIPSMGGGIFVLPLCNNPLIFLAVLFGSSLISAIALVALRKQKNAKQAKETVEA